MPTLSWLTRETDLQLSQSAPYRLLDAVPELSFGDPATGNMLIQGDNLDALKALLPYYAGQVKCIYIDPPYNTKSAFEHYDDNLEHAKWLSMMYPRLELLRELLAQDGSIWVSIDDNEGHYLKVIMDEIFGRKNFIANVLWQKRTSPDARLMLGAAHDHIFVYGKAGGTPRLNKLSTIQKNTSAYKNPDNDPRGPWVSTDFTAQGWRPNQMYSITTPGGVTYEPPGGRCWVNIETEFIRLQGEGRIWFGSKGCSRPRIKNFLSEQRGVSVWSWWSNDEVGHNQESKKEIIQLFSTDDAFDTPKPERLLRRIIEIASNPGDLILDSFVGSGTTAAVAHKMGRRYIGIEMGEHAATHCSPRLRKVIEGEQGGISKAVNWQGGGGFRFYRLGEAVFDEAGRINQDIRFGTLAAHVWFCETKIPLLKESDIPLLGIHNDTAYYLLFNGILGDRRPEGGNVLTRRVLKGLPPHDGPKVIYGELSRLPAEKLRMEKITFKQIPYDVKAR
ncbi:MAG: site-specific DNA-methyltransferase [Syntrophorhabdaceae bacterium]|nr:site-specific DNA-methyltransferase [Syntrophorhabdaceae bacterium]HOC45607.1 site-specific DNA-methyltransferase [Syntrophorhabdaceae bacterium]